MSLTPKQSSRARLKRNLLWNLGVGILSPIGTLVLFPIAARTAGLATYGLWQICFATVQLLLVVDFGFGAGVVRHVAAGLATGDEDAVVNSARLGAGLFALLALLLPLAMAGILMIYGHGLHMHGKRSHLFPSFVVASSCALAIGMLGRYGMAMLQANGRFDLERQAALIGFTVRVAGIATCATTNAGALPIAYVEAAAIALPGAICLAIVHFRFLPVRLATVRMYRVRGVSFVRYSRAVFAYSFAIFATAQAPIYILGRVASLRDVAIYAAALRIFNGSRQIQSWIAEPFFARAAELAARPSTRPVLAELHHQLLRFTATPLLMFVFPVVVLSSHFTPVWLGREAGRASTAVLLLCLASIAAAGESVASVLLSACSQPQRLLAPGLLQLMATLVAVPTMASRWGATGAAAGFLLPICLMTPLLQRRASAVTGLTARSAAHALARPVAATGVATALTLGASQAFRPDHAFSLGLEFGLYVFVFATVTAPWKQSRPSFVGSRS